MNSYAATLHGNAALLWGARVVLLGAIVVHVSTALRLNRKASNSRPVGYVGKGGWLGASYATRTMRQGGYILLAFIIYHLLHLTWGAPVLPAEYVADADWSTSDVDVYKNVMNGFKFIPTALFYIVAQVMLGLTFDPWYSLHESNDWNFKSSLDRACSQRCVATGIGITAGNVASSCLA